MSDLPSFLFRVCEEVLGSSGEKQVAEGEVFDLSDEVMPPFSREIPTLHSKSLIEIIMLPFLILSPDPIPVRFLFIGPFFLNICRHTPLFNFL